MSSMEMGSFPFASELQPLTGYSELEENISTTFGNIKVSIFGDRSKEPIVTFHDMGLDAENNFQNFFQFCTAAEFSNRFCIYNINAPGQETDAKPLPSNYVYPTMDELAKIVEQVVEHFKFKSFIGFGIGVGANVLLRYAIRNHNKLACLVLVNCVATTAGWIEWGYQKMNIHYLRNRGMTSFTVDYLMWHHFGNHIHENNSDIVRQYRAFFSHWPTPTNLAAFIESYLNRTDIPLSRDGTNGPTLKVPVLQIIGSRSAFIHETVYVNSNLDPSKSDYIKVPDSCGLVLDDRPDAVTESLMLFLQGMGYFPTVNISQLISRLRNNMKHGNAQLQAVENVNETANEDSL